MIIKAGQVRSVRCDDIGQRSEEQIGPAGGLQRLGVNIVTLMPGETSTYRHWHEAEDEFLYLLEGRAVVVENDGVHEIGPGDMCCWPAGVDNAHHVLNRSNAPARYLVVGSGAERDCVHYPDQGQTMHHQPPRWWVEDAAGNILREGTTD